MTQKGRRYSNWIAMASRTAPGDEELLNAAFAAAPEWVGNDSVFLSRSRDERIGRCRICGQYGALTKEHVPPRAAGNMGETRLHTLLEYLQRDGVDAPLSGGRVQQGGIFGYTLCKRCNETTGHGSRGLAREYAAWAQRAASLLVQAGPLEQLDTASQPVSCMLVSKEFGRGHSYGKSCP